MDAVLFILLVIFGTLILRERMRLRHEIAAIGRSLKSIEQKFPGVEDAATIQTLTARLNRSTAALSDAEQADHARHQP